MAMPTEAVASGPITMRGQLGSSVRRRPTRRRSVRRRVKEAVHVAGEVKDVLQDLSHPVGRVASGDSG